jgi:hypothetical protein
MTFAPCVDRLLVLIEDFLFLLRVTAVDEGRGAIDEAPPTLVRRSAFESSTAPCSFPPDMAFVAAAVALLTMSTISIMSE